MPFQASRAVAALLLLLAIPASARAQATHTPDTCPVADSVLGTSAVSARRAPVVQRRIPDGTEMLRTGTRMLSASGLAISAAIAAAPNGARSVEIQLEATLAADAVRERVLAQDSMYLILDADAPIALGIPGTARADVPVPRLPLLIALPEDALLALAQARAAQVRIGPRSVAFTPVDLRSAHRLARIILCASRSR